MIRTRVGYAGGTKKNPTYRDLGDHTETVQIDYDPTQISYGELLAVFWESHHPGQPSWSRQYRAAVFYHHDAQERLARETRAQVAAGMKGKVFTEILPAPEFYLAEGYHQKYYLRQLPELFHEFSSIYPGLGDLVASTAAARVNGYVAGYGTVRALQGELADLGLSPEGRQRLFGLVAVAVHGGATRACPRPR